MLAFFLQGHLSAWGGFTPGTERPTTTMPGRSQLLGLLGACLGLERDDEAGFERLSALRFGVLGLHRGKPVPALRDLHTVKVPQFPQLGKGLDETFMPKIIGHEGILTHRFYGQDAAHVVVAVGPPELLGEVEGALRRPHYTPFLGRRACPPAAPFAPMHVEGDGARQAAFQYLETRNQAGKEPWLPLLWQADERFEAGIPRLRNDDLVGAPAARAFRARTVYEEVIPFTSAD